MAIAQYGDLTVCLETNQERYNYTRLQSYSVETWINFWFWQMFICQLKEKTFFSVFRLK